MTKALANLFILQKEECYSINSDSDICVIVSPNKDIAKKKFLALFKLTNKYNKFKFYHYWLAMSIENYENHRHRRYTRKLQSS